MSRLVTRNPFLCIALVAGFSYGLSFALRMWLGHVEAGMVVFEVFYWLGRPFLWAGSFVDDLAPNLPTWGDRTAVIALGLMPYLLADWIWRRLRLAADLRAKGRDRD